MRRAVFALHPLSKKFEVSMHNYWLLIAGIVAFLIAIFSLWKSLMMRRGGIRTVGVIVGVEQERNEGTLVYRPLVHFVTTDGQQLAWKSTSAASFWRNATGKSMHIIYDPRNPHRVIRDSWTDTVLPVVVCLILCAVSLVVFFGGGSIH